MRPVTEQIVEIVSSRKLDEKQTRFIVKLRCGHLTQKITCEGVPNSKPPQVGQSLPCGECYRGLK